MRFLSLSTPGTGPQSGVEDVEELRTRLNEAQSRSEDLAARLESSTASLEQYRAMCLSLEEALEKEKQVCNWCIIWHITSAHSCNVLGQVHKTTFLVTDAFP